MPLYEYQCQQCAHRYEKIESIHAAKEQHCEACGKLSAHRIISNTNFQLKGSGWYVTDFKDKKPAADTKKG